MEVKFGRLDLRGFIRSEIEDSSFSVLEIYQPLHGEREGQSEGASSRPLVQLIRETRAVSLLIGPPGSGKSFFLRWLALHEIRQALEQENSRIPVYVSLAAFAVAPGAPSLVDYIIDVFLENDLQIVHGLFEALANGRALLLLDGLDEAGDTSARMHVISAAREFAYRFPKTKVVATSRQTGLDEVDIHADEIYVSPLVGLATRELLINWCRLYELHRSGSREGELRGRTEGELLAAQVMSSASLRRLATSPLLATIIAIVHRSGVRLPEHRAELYEHIIRILVERWNQIRSEVARPGPPLKMSDAIRLLGPVALDIIKLDLEGAVEEAALVEILERTLNKGNVRGVSSATDALQLFKRSLGLLVERAPGIFGFLHQTFVEFLAAHELIRTGELDALCKRPRDAFLPKWREVILLSAGIVGQVQAADERLNSMVRAVVASSGRRQGRPSAAVPSLLAGLIADDPALTPVLVTQLLDVLIPKWWFGRQYSGSSMQRVTSESVRLAHQILQGVWADLLVERLPRCRSTLRFELLVGPKFMTELANILNVLGAANVEIVGVLYGIAQAARTADLHTGMCVLPYTADVTSQQGTYEFVPDVSPGVGEMLLREELRTFWRISLYDMTQALLTTNSFSATQKDGRILVWTKQKIDSEPVRALLYFVPARVNSSAMKEFSEIVHRHDVS
jgi:hypothetical protein